MKTAASLTRPIARQIAPSGRLDATNFAAVIDGRWRSPRSEVDADHVKVKTEMLQLRLMEKRRELVRRADVDAPIDEIAGTVLTHLSGMSARCSLDMQVRRNIDAVVMQIRREINEACSRAAGECGEPPLGEKSRRPGCTMWLITMRKRTVASDAICRTGPSF